MEVKIDKELLRLRLEAEGCDTSQMDMDLAVEYEKAAIETKTRLWAREDTSAK